MNNPLLADVDLPSFPEIRAEHVLPALDARLSEAKAATESLLGTDVSRFDDLVPPLALALERVGRSWSPVSHLNAVKNEEALRKAYTAGLPRLSEFFTAVRQDERLFRAYRSLASSPEAKSWDPTRRKIVDEALRDFKLSGAELPEKEKKRFSEISAELSVLSSRFSDHVLDDTNEFRLHVPDVTPLSGLGKDDLEVAATLAKKEGKEGFLFTLQAPSYLPFMKQVTDRALRRDLYFAYMTRATKGERDNTPVIRRILSLRLEMAKLLGYRSYAEVSLATKMAKTPETALSFLEDLLARSRSAALRELDELRAFARSKGETADLEPWDIAYWSERLREEKYAFSEEELRPYFPEPVVLQGLFAILRRLYGYELRQVKAELWHPEATLWELFDETGEKRGRILMDLHARENKRGGAWMDECLARLVNQDGSVRLPAAHLVCNFRAPQGDKPSCLTHDEVVTLFHEMGHVLHHLSSRVELLDAAGLNGVPWDGVELPSQFHESWCFEEEALSLLSKHVDTGAPLPESLLSKVLAAKNFQSAMAMVRQLEFSILDLKLHHGFDPEAPGADVDEAALAIREPIALLPIPSGAKMQNGFTHIFAGGYAAGYYSYKWAEVLAEDAYSLFEEKGLFDAASGRAFRACILEKGGSEDFMELYRRFRGRGPTVDALLRRSGIRP